MGNGLNRDDFDECEERLRAELGRAVLPPELWGRLWQEDFVIPAILEGPKSSEWRELVAAARRFAKEKREEDPGTNLPPEGRDRKPEKTAGTRLDDYTRLRAETFSEVAGALAHRWAQVRRFRDIYLGSTHARLTNEEAGAWVYGNQAPANAREDMKEISRRLSRAFRWRTEDADWFLLTGCVPFVQPVNVSVRFNSTRDTPSYLNREYFLQGPDFMVDTAEIVIRAEPWVDADTVSKWFRDVQKQVRGGDNHKLTAKVLDAVRFVARRLGTDKVEWPSLRSEWNDVQEDPRRRYNSRNGLYKAFHRFIRPKYGDPAYPDYEPTPWQIEKQKAVDRRVAQMKSLNARLGPPLGSAARRA